VGKKFSGYNWEEVELENFLTIFKFSGLCPEPRFFFLEKKKQKNLTFAKLFSVRKFNIEAKKNRSRLRAKARTSERFFLRESSETIPTKIFFRLVTTFPPQKSRSWSARPARKKKLFKKNLFKKNS